MESSARVPRSRTPVEARSPPRGQSLTPPDLTTRARTRPHGRGPSATGQSEPPSWQRRGGSGPAGRARPSATLVLLAGELEAHARDGRRPPMPLNRHLHAPAVIHHVQDAELAVLGNLAVAVAAPLDPGIAVHRPGVRHHEATVA